jgi:hypothetical protein
MKGYHKESNVTVKLSLAEDPVELSNFTYELASTYLVRPAAWSTQPLNLTDLPGVTSGVNATIQVSTFDAHSEYSCIDVILMDVSVEAAKAKSSGLINFTSMGTTLLSVILSLQL